MNRTILLTVVLLAIINKSIHSQKSDTVALTKNIPLESISQKPSSNKLTIRNKSFILNNDINKTFFNYLVYDQEIFTTVDFINCSIIPDTSSIPIWLANIELANNWNPTKTTLSKGNFQFDSCFICNLALDSIIGDMFISRGLIERLIISNTTNFNLALNSDTALDNLRLKNNRNMNLQLSECEFKNNSSLEISNSTISKFSFRYNKFGRNSIIFQNDTINSFIVLKDFYSKNKTNDNNGSKYENSIDFNNCYVDAEFSFYESIPNSTITFNNCTFGKNLSFRKLAINKLVIKNCKIINKQLALAFQDSEKKVSLEILNSDLTQIDFDFSANMTLVFDPSQTKDAILNGYKTILEKFKNEGKSNSYMFVDLQYRKYNDSKFFHFLNQIWWHHGYNPSLVFVWTAGLLIIFYILNLIFWKHMYETYPIVDWKKDSYYARNNLLPVLSIVFLYTIFIFFSLRVSLDKLKFNRLGYTYFFLFQYLAGLWSLIFIFKYIFKT